MPTAPGNRAGRPASEFADPVHPRLQPFLAGWAAYAVYYFAFCFHPGMAASDDFGYLRSILGTLASHRPFVYDWLEPYCAVFSSACALLYALTGNFLLSAWGFQACCALAFYPLLFRLLSARLRPAHAALLALAVAAFPLFLAKAGDFHAGTCTLDLLLLALIAFEARRFGWFFLAALAAFANRQNHICLLVLPLWQTAVDWKRGRPVTWVIPMGLIAWVGGALALARVMNGTYAAQHAAFRHSPPSSLAAHGALALAAGIFLALGWLALATVLTGRSLAWRRRTRGWIPPAVLALCLLALIPFWGPSLLRTDTPLFGFTGWAQINRYLPWCLLAAVVFADLRLLRPSPYVALACGYLAIASLRGIWWDYYFMEIILLCLLLALDGAPAPILPRLSLAALSLSLALDTGYAYLFKIQADKSALSVAVMEKLERGGQARVDAMTGATFGYLGWKLFDYYTAHDGERYSELQDFLGYVKRDRIVIDTELPWRRAFKAPLPPGADSLGGGEARIGFATLRYRVADLHGPASGVSLVDRPMLLPASFHPPRFPLDNREWADLIRTLPRR